MAESYIQAPPDSSGKKAHTFNRTIGANSVEDEVVLLGENYLASYITGNGGNLVSTATANSHVMQIMAGASLKVRVRRIEVHQMVGATTAAFCQWLLVRTTTAGTGGTATTPNPLDPTDAACGATMMTLPTVKGTEALTMWSGTTYFNQTAAASLSLPQPILTIDFDRPRSKPLIIAAGITNGLVLKNVTAIAAATVAVTVWFDESNF